MIRSGSVISEIRVQCVRPRPDQRSSDFTGEVEENFWRMEKQRLADMSQKRVSSGGKLGTRVLIVHVLT